MKNPPINNISKNEIHIFIIWEKARYKEDEIFNNLKKDFLIIDVIDIEWSKSLFSNNLTRFYGQNLPIGSHKEEHVGNGEFRLIIIQDKKPLYQARQTSKGISFVNINTFDRKSFFRELTGGGHKIHSSNTEIESRHDLFLILGIDAKKYFNKTSNEWDNKIKSHRGDLVGANSWSNLDELFVIMDNTIDEYVVLRNFEKLPHHYDSKIHGDIDLLLKNSQNANYVINGKKVYVDEFRVLNNVKFKNGNILFDFRYLGDNYIDINWGRDILKNFEYYHSLRVPNKEDHFYSLLYHAYIHKEELPNKYQNLFHKILPESLKDIDANFFNSMDNITKLLNEFLIQKNYNFTMPDDISVMFNLDGIIDSKIKVDKKHTVVNRYIDKNKYGLVRSRVDVVSKNDVPMIRKLASGALSSREFHFLKSLEAYKYFPKVNNLFVGKNFSLFFQEFIQGKKIDSPDFLKNLDSATVHIFVFNCLKMLRALKDNNITHRDIHPDNIIVKDNLPYLIDFQWAIDPFSDIYTPEPLGKNFASEGKHCDTYSMGVCLLPLSCLFPTIYPVVEAMSRPDSRSRITDFDDLKEILYRYDLTNEDKKYFKNSLENKIFENNFFTNRNLDKLFGNQIFNKLDDYYELDATSEKKLIEIATSCLNSSDYHQAKKFFDIILINNPLSIEALYGNSIIAYAYKNYDESVSFLDSILNIESNHSIALNQYGIIELERNNISKAKNLFSKSIKFDESFIDPKRFLAECEIINGDHQKGLDLYLNIVSTFKDDTVSMKRIADLLRESGNEEEANKWEDVASKQTEYENTINPLP